jgi:DNA-binding transcriptional LysR family regulator
VLDFQELQIFLAAAETENFSEAGRRLNISQPAISMQIQALETRLGVQLFHRSGRYINLTDAGRTLMPLARDLINRMTQVEETMLSLQGEVIGVLKLGCSTTSGKYILPKLIARMHGHYPQVQILCHVTGREDALRMLLGGEVQIALTSLREPYKDVEYRPALVDHIQLVTRPDHPWAQRGAPIHPQDLLEGTFILREETSGTYLALKDGLAWHGISMDQVKPKMMVGNSEAIAMLIEEGMGVSFLSEMVTAAAVRAGRLAVIPVEGLELTQTLFLAHHTGRPATRAQSAFWDFCFATENEDIRQSPVRVLAEGA